MESLTRSSENWVRCRSSSISTPRRRSSNLFIPTPPSIWVVRSTRALTASYSRNVAPSQCRKHYGLGVLRIVSCGQKIYPEELMPTVATEAKGLVLLLKPGFIWRSIKHFGRNVKLRRSRSRSTDTKRSNAGRVFGFFSPPGFVPALTHFVRKRYYDYGCYTAVTAIHSFCYWETIAVRSASRIRSSVPLPAYPASSAEDHLTLYRQGSG